MKLIGSFIGGSGFTFLVNWLRGRLQKMQCHHIDEDILSKIPTVGDDGSQHENIYVKEFKLINTTNKDISRFKVLFQFDPTSKIIKSYNKSKSGSNEYKMKKGKCDNECYVHIDNFNRRDKIFFTFHIADVTDNKYYIRENDCTGFRIICKSKLRAKEKIKSKMSTEVLTRVSPISVLE
ncbi:MAG: hypothetical protein LBM20_02540 [Rikenellaceae bacterium]|nr:hypothetical protein [Rikenellaceae bacterium]